MLPTWFWVLLWVVLAVAALALLGWMALRVWRKIRDLFGEIAEVTDRAAEAVDLLAQVDLPGEPRPSESDFDGDATDRAFTAAHRVKSDLPT